MMYGSGRGTTGIFQKRGVHGERSLVISICKLYLLLIVVIVSNAGSFLVIALQYTKKKKVTPKNFKQKFQTKFLAREAVRSSDYHLLYLLMQPLKTELKRLHSSNDVQRRFSFSPRLVAHR